MLNIFTDDLPSKLMRPSSPKLSFHAHSCIPVYLVTHDAQGEVFKTDDICFVPMTVMLFLYAPFKYRQLLVNESQCSKTGGATWATAGGHKKMCGPLGQMGWAGAMAKLVLVWLVLRGLYTGLLDPAQQRATDRVLSVNGGRLWRRLRAGGPPPPVERAGGGPLPDALAEGFTALHFGLGLLLAPA